MKRSEILISKIERAMLANFFDNNGYVLDFSNKEMADFTIESIGFDVQDKYKLSKGKSLRAFFQTEDDKTVFNLTQDLVAYVDNILSDEDRNEYIGNQVKQYKKIKDMLKKFTNNSAFDLTKIDYSDLQNDEYLSDLIKELSNNVESNPASVIGQTKDLLEAVYKRILEHYDVHYENKSNMTKLLSQVNEVLELVPNDQDKSSSIGKISAKILGNFDQVANGMNELRNQFGRGHGRGKTQIGSMIVPRRYADLAVGSASVLINFLTETVKHVDNKNKEIKINSI